TGSLPPLIWLCLAATWLVWGSTYLAIKFALVSFPPFFQMGTRFLFAGVVLGLIGVVMLTQGAGFGASPAGLAAISIACVTWSLGSVLSQRRWPLAPGATGFASEMICGGAVLLLISGVQHEQPQW